MARNDPIERALTRLGELRHAGPTAAVTEELRGLLLNRSNLVAAKAAAVVRELRIVALVPELATAFNKFMADAPRLDKRCAALTEITSALYELDYDQPDPYLAGIRHVQLEGSFGPPVDEAAKLRAVSAQGLLRTQYAEALFKVVELLVDREPAARIGAIRALAANGGEAGTLLLRLKVLTGDGAARMFVAIMRLQEQLLNVSQDAVSTDDGRHSDTNVQAIEAPRNMHLQQTRHETCHIVFDCANING